MLSLIAIPFALSGPVVSHDAAVVTARLAEFAPLRAQRVAHGIPAIPADAWTRAATSGEVITGVAKIEGAGQKTGWGVAVLDVPLDRMWAGLNDEMQHQDILDLDHVEVTRGNLCEDRRHVLMVLPLPLVSDRWWVVENHYNPGLEAASGGRAYELAWMGLADPLSENLSAAARDKVDGAVAVTENVGAWLLIDLDGSRTLAEYHAYSDPGGNLPAGPAAAFASASIAGTVEKVAGYARTATSTCLGR